MSVRRGPTVIVEDAAWRRGPRDLVPSIKRAIQRSLEAGGTDVGLAAQVTVLLTGDDRLRALNRQFRGKDTPTNVLSFPAATKDGLGDIAIAHGVVAGEARAQGKDFSHHAIHLAVHGTLHLLGYDHEMPAEAKIMEQLEKEILARLGIADPYRRTKRKAA
jgi:probable rRNA maturation factor